MTYCDEECQGKHWLEGHDGECADIGALRALLDRAPYGDAFGESRFVAGKGKPGERPKEKGRKRKRKAEKPDEPPAPLPADKTISGLEQTCAMFDALSACPSVAPSILFYLSPGDITRLYATCKGLRKIIESWGGEVYMPGSLGDEHVPTLQTALSGLRSLSSTYHGREAVICALNIPTLEIMDVTLRKEAAEALDGRLAARLSASACVNLKKLVVSTVAFSARGSGVLEIVRRAKGLRSISLDEVDFLTESTEAIREHPTLSDVSLINCSGLHLAEDAMGVRNLARLELHYPQPPLGIPTTIPTRRRLTALDVSVRSAGDARALLMAFEPEALNIHFDVAEGPSPFSAFGHDTHLLELRIDADAGQAPAWIPDLLHRCPLLTSLRVEGDALNFLKDQLVGAVPMPLLASLEIRPGPAEMMLARNCVSGVMALAPNIAELRIENVIIDMEDATAIVAASRLTRLGILLANDQAAFAFWNSASRLEDAEIVLRWQFAPFISVHTRGMDRMSNLHINFGIKALDVEMVAMARAVCPNLRKLHLSLGEVLPFGTTGIGDLDELEVDHRGDEGFIGAYDLAMSIRNVRVLRFMVAQPHPGQTLTETHNRPSDALEELELDAGISKNFVLNLPETFKNLKVLRVHTRQNELQALYDALFAFASLPGEQARRFAVVVLVDECDHEFTHYAKLLNQKNPRMCLQLVMFRDVGGWPFHLEE